MCPQLLVFCRELKRQRDSKKYTWRINTLKWPANVHLIGNIFSSKWGNRKIPKSSICAGLRRSEKSFDSHQTGAAILVIQCLMGWRTIEMLCREQMTKNIAVNFGRWLLNVILRILPLCAEDKQQGATTRHQNWTATNGGRLFLAEQLGATLWYDKKQGHARKERQPPNQQLLPPLSWPQNDRKKSRKTK